MTFAILTERITGNSSATFDFSSTGQPIGAMVYGLQQLSLVSGTPGAHVQNFGTSLSVAPGTGVGYSEVVLVQQIATGMDPSTTFAEVSVLAFLGGANPPNVYLGNQRVGMGATGQVIQPQNPPGTTVGVLGGFLSSFNSDSSDLLGVGAGVGMACVPGSTEVAPVGFGALIGDSAYSGTVDAGNIVLASGQVGIFVQAVPFTSATNNLAATLGGNVSAATALVQSFYAQFKSSEDPTPDLVSLTVGTTGLTVSGATVTGQLDLTYSGEYTTGSPYGGHTYPGVVSSTVGTALVIGTV